MKITITLPKNRPPLTVDTDDFAVHPSGTLVLLDDDAMITRVLAPGAWLEVVVCESR